MKNGEENEVPSNGKILEKKIFERVPMSQQFEDEEDLGVCICGTCIGKDYKVCPFCGWDYIVTDEDCDE